MAPARPKRPVPNSAIEPGSGTDVLVTSVLIDVYGEPWPVPLTAVSKPKKANWVAGLRPIAVSNAAALVSRPDAVIAPVTPLLIRTLTPPDRSPDRRLIGARMPRAGIEPTRVMVLRFL